MYNACYGTKTPVGSLEELLDVLFEISESNSDSSDFQHPHDTKFLPTFLGYVPAGEELALLFASAELITLLKKATVLYINTNFQVNLYLAKLKENFILFLA